MASRTPRFQSEDRLTPARLNELVEAINRNAHTETSGGLQSQQTPTGTHLSAETPPRTDLVELDEDVLPGNLDARANLLRRDYQLPPGTNDVFAEVGHTLEHVVDHLESVWLAGTRGISLWLPDAAGRVLLPGFNWHRGVLDAELTHQSTAMVSLWGQDAQGALVDTGVDVMAHDWGLANGETLPAGTRVTVLQHPQNRQWYVVAGSSEVAIEIGKTQAPLSPGGSVPVQLWAGPGGAEVPAPDPPVTAHDWLATGSLASGSPVIVIQINGQWYLVHDLSDGGQAGTELVRFELTQSLPLGGGGTTPNALLVSWNGVNQYVTAGDPVIVRDFSQPGTWHGTAGARGIAFAPLDRTGQYEIVWMQLPAERIEGTLLGDLDGGTATGSVTQFYRGLDPGSTATVHDGQGIFGHLKTGARYLATYNDVEGRYEVTSALPAPLIRFELTSTLPLGGSTAAETVEWDGANYVPTGSGIIVRDFTGEKWHGAAGARGLAFEPPDRSGQYEIIWLELPAERIAGTLTGAWTSGTAPASVTNFYRGLDPGSTATVHDPQGLFTHAGTGDKFLATYNDRDQRYEVTAVRPPMSGGESANLLRFELSTPLVPGGSANAQELSWDSGGSTYTTSPGGVPNPTLTVRDSSDPGSWRGETGFQGFAYEPADRTGQFEILWLEQLAERIAGTLTEDLNSGIPGEAAATVNGFYRGQDPGATVIVHDTQGMFPWARSGQKFLATYQRELGHYEITFVQHAAQWVDFKVVSDFYFTSATFQAYVYHSWDGTPVHNPAATTDGERPIVVIENKAKFDGSGEFLFEGESAATGLAQYDREAGVWRCVWVECPKVELVLPPSP